MSKSFTERFFPIADKIRKNANLVFGIRRQTVTLLWVLENADGEKSVTRKEILPRPRLYPMYAKKVLESGGLFSEGAITIDKISLSYLRSELNGSIRTIEPSIGSSNGIRFYYEVQETNDNEQPIGQPDYFRPERIQLKPGGVEYKVDLNRTVSPVLN